jgi:DmsE family decaheme c-type cytochrome
MKKWLPIIASLAALAVLIAVGAAQGQSGGADPAALFSPCGDCHDTVAADMLRNPHGRSALRAPEGFSGQAVCESCHGDGAAHLDDPSAANISIPRGTTGAASCLTCHEGHREFSGALTGAHLAAGVACETCHQMHQSVPKVALVKAGSDCAACHSSQRASFRKPFAHRLDAGAMSCASCHNPHGGRGGDSLKVSVSGASPCVSCHAEKAGPFVFPHVTGVTGDCTTCHEPHGSNNAKQLTRVRVDRLCLECHSTLLATNLGSQPPSFHDLRSPRYRECTVCHVAVHGSNSSPMLLK